MRSRQRRAAVLPAKVALAVAGMVLVLALAVYSEVADPSTSPLYPSEPSPGGGR